MSHIFISYSRKNQTEAAKLVQLLRRNRFIVWQDVSSIRGGEHWVSKITSALVEAQMVILLWSEAASQSKWVAKEIEIAYAQDKHIIPIDLDGTALPPNIAVKNKIDWRGGSDAAQKAILKDIPRSYQRQPLPFDPYQPLGEQLSADPPHVWRVEGQELIALPLLQSGYCRAYAVGLRDKIMGDPSSLIVALQVSRAVDSPFIPDVYRNFLSENPAHQPSDFCAVLITVPINAKNEYRLDNDNSAEWFDAIDTTYDAIHLFSKSRRPILQVYNLGTVALAFGLGMQFWRFWHVQLYNFAAGGYVRVLDIPPDSD